MKQYAYIFGGIALIGAVIVFLLIRGFGNNFEVTQKPQTSPTQNQTQSSTSASNTSSTSQQTASSSALNPTLQANPLVIGTSVQGRDIDAYHYGTGDTELLFVGGIHGGYSWNTSAVAYQLIDYLAQNQGSIPSNLKITVIPVLNPDGLYKIAGTDGRVSASDITTTNTVPGRFNANNVDLNRNFDCDWQATGVWQKQQVSGGASAFSEPESQAIRDYIASHKVTAVVAWYSAAGGVFSSNCHNGVLPETTTLTDLFAQASGYKAYDTFDFYTITGDMMNWLAKKNIPAISVLLTNHTDTEWSKNLAGIQAILDHYKQ